MIVELSRFIETDYRSPFRPLREDAARAEARNVAQQIVFGPAVSDDVQRVGGRSPHQKSWILYIQTALSQ